MAAETMRFSTHSVITIVFMSQILFFKNICVTKYFYKLLLVTTFTMCTVTIAAVITSGLVRGPSFTQLVPTHIETRLDVAQSGCLK